MQTKAIENAVEEAGNVFQGYYLDYLNNFITAKVYAEHYGISKSEAIKRITIGMKIHEQRTDK